MVVAGHLWLAGKTLPPRLGQGADRGPGRIEVSFVQELQPTAPPAVAPAPQPVKKARRLRSTLASESAASTATAVAEEPLVAAAPLPEPAIAQSAAAADLPDLAALPDVVAAAEPAASVAASDNPALEWPPSTRLVYKLTGNYRGPVEGQAQVEWLRRGERYQVFMDLSIGPSFAPLISRRVSSEGLIGPDGLHPQRYDEVTEAVFNAPRVKHIDLDDDRVHLPDRDAVPRPAGVQDSASQFVQLTWIFTTRPALLQAGSHVAIPLALPRRVDTWIYDVLETETLPTPAGPVEAVHVKPRREAKPGRDLTAEVWLAPSLQYLPVRILIRQGPDSFLDLLIDRLPQQAAERAEGAASAARR